MTSPSQPAPVVLIVEDEQTVREFADFALSRAGYSVRTAGSPREALALLSSGLTVDVVLTDVVMPEMTGYDFVDEARRIAPAARVVFMSGHRADQFRRGTDERFLPKPFTVASLRSIVSDAAA